MSGRSFRWFIASLQSLMFCKKEKAIPPSATSAPPSWHVEHATCLPEIWARIAVFSGPVRAWQLTGVCRAAREGAKERLRTLPGLVVVCGGVEGDEDVLARRVEAGYGVAAVGVGVDA